MPRPQKIISYEMTKLGGYLKRLREELHLSIREVAGQTKLTPSHIFKLEAGNTFKSTGVEVLVRLSKVYGISIGDILQEAGFIAHAHDELPELAPYLRAKYHYPPHAIRDMEMAKELVEKKYDLK